jgi:hypothetical protein
MAGELVSSLVHELQGEIGHLPERDRKNMVDYAVLFGQAAEAIEQGMQLRADDRVPDGRTYFEVVRSVHRLARERHGKGPGRDEGAVIDHLADVLSRGLEADPRDEVRGAAFPGETLGDLVRDWVAACRTPHFKTARDLPLVMDTLTKASADGTGVLNPSERLEDGRRIRRIVIELGQDVSHSKPLHFKDDERAVILALARLWRGQAAAPVADLSAPCEGGGTVGGHLDAWRNANGQCAPRP